MIEHTSEYTIGDLVEFAKEPKAQSNSFGRITLVTFFKADECHYTIMALNSGEMSNGVNMKAIVKKWVPEC